MRRRAVRPDEAATPRVAKEGGLWRVRALGPARDVLRARHVTTQAGFTAEKIPQVRMRHRPILIADGPGHDEQRRKVARFFAPKVVDERYRELLETTADQLLDACGAQPFDLDDLALHFAVEVTAEIVGLTHVRRGDDAASRRRRIRAMSNRLVAFFRQPPADLSRRDYGRTPRQWLQAAWRGLVPVATLWFFDVRPAVRQRRRRPRPDVITHLIDEGYSGAGLLVECVTYGTAGMVTTREFIAMAAWHLLTDDDLRSRYQACDEDGRIALLHELIRLEPVVGHLYRRVHADLVVADGEETWTIPAGDLVDVQVRPVNVDPAAFAPDPEAVCPHRAVPGGTNPTGLTFGDGAHKCPGQPLAMLEADVLLSRLLARGCTLLRAPDVGWDDLVAGYELRGMRVRLAG